MGQMKMNSMMPQTNQSAPQNQSNVSFETAVGLMQGLRVNVTNFNRFADPGQAIGGPDRVSGPNKL